MKKIEGHIHLIRAMAGSKGQGRLNPLGNGYAIWDDGEIIHLLPAGWGDDDFRVEKYLPIMAVENIEKAVLLQGTLNGLSKLLHLSSHQTLSGSFYRRVCRGSIC